MPVGPSMSVKHPCGTGADVILGLAISALFKEQMLPTPGDIIDAGANSGVETCIYSDMAPSRVVHAVEPIPSNHLKIATFMSGRKIELHKGVLSDAPGRFRVRTEALNRAQLKLSLDQATASSSVTSNVIVHTIDEIVRSSNHRSLAFLHLDTEGHELPALQGAVRTLATSRPAFTVELYIHHGGGNNTRKILEFARSFKYACAVADELVGAGADGRNLLCLPREKRWRRFFARYSLQPVDVESIFSMATYCADGGACCPYGRQSTQVFDPDKRIWTSCCSTRGCFLRLPHEVCTASGALNTSWTQPCWSKRTSEGVKHRHHANKNEVF